MLGQPTKLTLPTEVKMLIAEQLFVEWAYDGSNLLNILLVDKIFLEICRPLCYRSMNLEFGGSDHLLKRAILWCRTVSSNTLIAKYVQSLSIQSDRIRRPRYSLWNQNNDQNNMAGCAPYRLLIKTLSCLGNLRSLWLTSASLDRSHDDHDFDPEYDVDPLLMPHIQFPRLEELNYLGGFLPFDFLQRHPSIKKFVLWGRRSVPPEQLKYGILPNLRLFAGSMLVLLCVDPSAPLQHINIWPELLIRNYNVENTLALLSYGRNLRWLKLRLCWEEGLFGKFAKAAPNLEALYIENAQLLTLDGNREPGDYCFEKDFFADATQTKWSMLSLQCLVIYSPNILWGWGQILEWIVKLQNTSCPAIRFVSIFNWANTVQQDWYIHSWRFDQTRHVWIPPLCETQWWETEAGDSVIRKKEYDAIQRFTCHWDSFLDPEYMEEDSD